MSNKQSTHWPARCVDNQRQKQAMSGVIDAKCAVRVQKANKGELDDDPSETLMVTFLGCHMSVPNALRRIMLSCITTLALDGIEFTENHSVMNTHMLIQRLEMLPLKSDQADMLRAVDKCNCASRHCPHCSLEFVFDVSGPTAVAGATRTMTEKNLVPKVHLGDEGEDGRGGGGRGASNKRLRRAATEFVYKNMPITKLGNRTTRDGNIWPDRISGRAFARAGVATMGPKWHAVSAVGFTTPVHLKLRPAAIDIEDCRNALIASCPQRLFVGGGGGNKLALHPQAANKCIKCLQCLQVVDPVDKKPVVEYHELSEPQTLSIDSIGQLPAVVVVSQAFDVLQRRILECISFMEKR